MKMTNEERSAFFAQYWGQKVARHSNQSESVNVMCPLYSIDYLELRSVEQLERHELENICDLVWGEKLDRKLGYDIYIKDLLHPNSRIYFTKQKVLDECRRLGVLIPFRHFTPEMLIAEGVVKVKVV